MTKEHEIPRTVMTAEQLRKEPKLPGFFDNGPAHFDEQLLDGEYLFNPVSALVMVIKTSEGYRLLTGVRSPEEERQPNVASVITARQSHASTRRVMQKYDEYRVPILGQEHSDIQHEGYHITEIDTANPILVANYEPRQGIGSFALKHTLSTLTYKLNHYEYSTWDRTHAADEKRDKLMKHASYWPGPTLVGISDVGEAYSDIGGYFNDSGSNGNTTLYEANIMSSLIVALNLSRKTPEEILKFFPSSNRHYSHFDLAPIDTFDQAVKQNIVNYVAPRFEARNLRVRGGNLPLHILACAKGLCLRVGAVALSRHMKHIRKALGDDPDDTKRIYQVPIQLDLPDR